MNISLTNPEANLQAEIDEHQDIMRSAGYNIIGTPVMLPDDQKEYPGSYQVWSPFFDPETRVYLWVYVNPEGQAIQMEYLPEAEFMENR